MCIPYIHVLAVPYLMIYIAAFIVCECARSYPTEFVEVVHVFLRITVFQELTSVHRFCLSYTF